MIKIATSKARQDIAEVLRKVKQGKRFLLENHDKGIAAIVSVEDLALLEAIENRRDLEDARRALVEMAKAGVIPWEEAKRQLSLQTGESHRPQTPARLRLYPRTPLGRRRSPNRGRRAH